MLDPQVQALLVDAARRQRRDGGAEADPGPGSGRARAPDPLPDGLTGREAEVLGLIAGGKTNTQIAAALYVSEATVKTHINHLFAKTGVRDRGQAVAYAYQHHLAPDL